MGTEPRTAQAAPLPAIAGVDFQVYRLKTDAALWVHPAFAAGPLCREPVRSSARRAFSDCFGYAVPGAACLDELGYEQDPGRTAVGERYGGRGIGSNGGGVRAGNIGGYQVKGLGQNPLAGLSTPFLHRYGALTAGEAVYEAIYAYLLEAILPVGPVRIHGVIPTGPQAAYLRYDDAQPESASAGHRCWGALMVRDLCRRPAHFLRAQDYVPLERHRAALAPDVARVRAVNRALLRECGGAEGFVGLLAAFLQNCAKQFAYGQVHGLAHGTLTPSNMALDGRWLDLARCTFYPMGQNNGAFVASGKEWRYPLAVVAEWARTFCKYNRLDLNTKPLTPYYERLFQMCRRYCLFELLGLEWCEDGGPGLQAACVELAAFGLRIVDAPRARTLALPARAEEDDAAGAWLAWLACGAEVLSVAQTARLRALFSDDELALARRHYASVAAATHARRGGSPCTLQSHLAERLTVAVRTIRLREFFYKKRLDDVIFATFRSGGPAAMQALMDDAVDLVDWAYADQDAARIWLYRGNGVQIYRERHGGRYCLASGALRCYPAAAQLRQALDQLPAHLTELAGFQFQPYLRDLLDLLAALERQACT